MILKETLREIARQQLQQLHKMDTGISRRLLKQIDQKSAQVVVISGIRRCGKSTLLLQIMKQLPDFYYFNFEDPRSVSFEAGDFEKLDAVFHEEFGLSTCYLFDEIQNVPSWERFVRRLQDTGNKVYLTGSNASLLSRELGSRLTGRHLQYELFPFSFPEALDWTGALPSQEHFNRYLRDGGFPEYLKYANIDILHQLFRDLITRDIVGRYNLREPRILLELAVFLLSNAGNEFSYNRLKNHFQLGSINTAISYVSFLEESYLLFTVPRFDFSYTKQRTYAKKIYGIDPGIIHATSASMSPDIGRLLENIVFLRLRQRWQEIYYFKDVAECDFLVKQEDGTIKAIQVCQMLNEENVQRELSGLQKAMENVKATEGFILTQNQEDTVQGLGVKPIWRWLLEESKSQLAGRY